ncbi:hypothetical protein GCM10007390_18450 [Persicitalea jodogahamensis]|uniref:Outer membrane protein beta-barrel domain-containing protein n=1 Tax=Persicitalea jodogahamensis TaxID=402147 RepID=A0A8J3D7M4_9BACT|nr:hypothetical protein GCM10007390_18450 [Persicitalea jodogahamensis]
MGLLNGAFPAWAQTQKGKHLVGMQAGELSLSLRDTRASSILLSPAYGKFVLSNLALGLELPFFYSFRNSPVPNRSIHIALTPFVRYYIGEGRVKPFVSVLAGPRYIYVRYSINSTETESESQTDLLYGARGGVAFFINSWVSLDLSLSYTETNKKAEYGYNSSNNALGYDKANRLAANLGFQIYLGKNTR